MTDFTRSYTDIETAHAGHIIQWDNQDKTVELQQYTRSATKDDLYYLAQKSAALLETVPYTVHLIIDERLFKLTLNSADIKFLEKNVPANQGAVVVIYGNLSLMYKQTIHATNKKVAPKVFEKGLFVPSLEDARQLLQEQFGVQYP